MAPGFEPVLVHTSPADAGGSVVLAFAEHKNEWACWVFNSKVGFSSTEHGIYGTEEYARRAFDMRVEEARRWAWKASPRARMEEQG